MIDWYVLLVPLVLAPIAALLAFVGCALDTEGKLRSITVYYKDIPKTTNPIDKIKASFNVPGKTVDPESVVKDDLEWNGKQIVEDKLYTAVFPGDGAVDCICVVDVFLTGNQLIATEKSTQTKTSDATLEFELTYMAWPDPDVYSGASFSLYPRE